MPSNESDLFHASTPNPNSFNHNVDLMASADMQPNPYMFSSFASPLGAVNDRCSQPSFQLNRPSMADAGLQHSTAAALKHVIYSMEPHRHRLETMMANLEREKLAMHRRLLQCLDESTVAATTPILEHLNSLSRLLDEGTQLLNNGLPGPDGRAGNNQAAYTEKEFKMQAVVSRCTAFENPPFE